jgi:hypothetical protein
MTNTDKYIEYNGDLRRILAILADKEKRLFIVTNAHFAYTHLVMTATMGDDWLDFFDFVNEHIAKKGKKIC